MSRLPALVLSWGDGEKEKEMTAIEYFENVYPDYSERQPLTRNEIIATMQDYHFHAVTSKKTMEEIAYGVTAKDVLSSIERKKIRSKLINNKLCESIPGSWHGGHLMRPSVEHYYETGNVSGRLRLTIEEIMEDYRRVCLKLYIDE